VAFVHPVTGGRVDVSSPLPSEVERLLRASNINDGAGR
jgi:hypothetical protein